MQILFIRLQPIEVILVIMKLDLNVRPVLAINSWKIVKKDREKIVKKKINGS